MDPLDTRALPAVVLPTGFGESVVASGLQAPAAMTVANDGRIFVVERTGAVRIVKDGQLLTQPFATLNVDQTTSQGLMGVTLDPNFARNNYVYVWYVVNRNGMQNNRLSRLTANGDTAVPGSEKVLFDFESFKIPPGVPAHNGGAIAFGPDGKIYITTGDMIDSQHSQSLTTIHGKVLRVNSDGTIPADNPYYRVTTGLNKAIWAIGLRNPFTFAIQPGTGKMYINDVGNAIWEEIDQGVPGANYGWPTTEGPTTDPRFKSPVFAYKHNDPGLNPGSVAITGGVFYNPAKASFPASYVGSYLFNDFGTGNIRRLDPATNQVQPFITGLGGGVVDLDLSPTGDLYALNVYKGEIDRIQYTPQTPPAFATPLANQTVALGQSVTFQATPTGTAPFQYQWQRNNVNIVGANSPTLTFTPTLADSGATYRLVVANKYGMNATTNATLTITRNKAPIAGIQLPSAGQKFRTGQTVVFAGYGYDPETGWLPASAYEWHLNVLHNDHTHTDTLVVKGKTYGSFKMPNHGDVGENVRYELVLKVTDKAGLTTTVSRIIYPMM